MTYFRRTAVLATLGLACSASQAAAEHYRERSVLVPRPASTNLTSYPSTATPRGPAQLAMPTPGERGPSHDSIPPAPLSEPLDLRPPTSEDTSNWSHDEPTHGATCEHGHALSGPPCQLAGGSYCSVCGSPSQLWSGSLGGLIMTRDQGNAQLFSFDTANEVRQLINSRDADMQWEGGFDARLRRYFHCGRNAAELVYWGLFPDTADTSITGSDVTGNLNGIWNWDQLDYNGGTADTFVNNAERHALWRDTEFHNLEANWLHFCSTCGDHGCHCHSLCSQYHWLAGVRYFKFQDNLLFGADTIDRDFTGAAEEIYYDIDMDNHLIGVQVGGAGTYFLNRRWTVDYGLKFGLFANYITHTSRIGGAAGAATINNGPNSGRAFLVDNDKQDMAFLGEADLALRYRISPCWKASLGYRALAVTGVALPENQIYFDLRGIQDVELVDSNGSLILHGGYASLEYHF